MRHLIFLTLLALSLRAFAQPAVQTDTLSFMFEGKKLTGLLDMPANERPTGMILLIPGSGKTTMLDGNGYYKRLRHFFAGQGLACFVWDKQGCGRSEGIYDDGDVPGSAREAVAAINMLKSGNIPGSEKIGLWGLSRGGWVCPLIIESYPSIAFWISVSGPGSEENFGYLLQRNFLAEGKSKEETDMLVRSWKSNLDIARHGGTFEENQKATELIRNDPFYQSITQGSPKPTKEAYLIWQKSLMSGENYPVNEKTGLQIYYPDLDKSLQKISCPVLAIFGEKDSQVDWQRTDTLYNETMGKHSPAILTVKTFPECNHNIFKCKTGGMREKLENYEFCDGYLETMAEWIKGIKK